MSGQRTYALSRLQHFKADGIANTLWLASSPIASAFQEFVVIDKHSGRCHSPYGQQLKAAEIAVHTPGLARIEPLALPVEAHLEVQLDKFSFQINDTEDTTLAPAQLGDHADSLLPAARIERAVVDRLDNLRESLKRDIWEFAVLGHDGVAIFAFVSELLGRKIQAEIEGFVTRREYAPRRELGVNMHPRARRADRQRGDPEIKGTSSEMVGLLSQPADPQLL